MRNSRTIAATAVRTSILGMSLLTASCDSRGKGELLPHTEVVLTPGMRVTATNANGTVEIHADGKATREFSGPGWKKRRKLIPRTERWYGSLGLCDPATSLSQYGRLLVDEGRLFFQTESEALRYLYVGSAHSKPVYTNRGLVVGFNVEDFPAGEATRSVELWQIYINGKRPTALKGADDTAIHVSGGIIPEAAIPNPAPVGQPPIFGKEEYEPSR